MDNIIIIRDLKFKYDEKMIFNGLNLDIEKGSFTTIIGPNGSGKSTLVRLILGLLKTESYINVNNLVLNNEHLENIRKVIGVVFENPDNQFVAQTVMDDLAFSLENMSYSTKEIKAKISAISKKFNLDDILNHEPHTLSSGQKQIVSLAAALINQPKILILDEALSMVEKDTRDQIFDLLIKMHQESDLTIINVTHDMEESIYGDDIIVLNDGNIEYYDTKEIVLTYEKELHKLGLELPFMALLSLKLMFYNLIDEMIFDMNVMVDKLWK